MHIIEYPSIGSTNDEARALLEGGRIAGTTLILAHHQSAGRGTRGRTWVSPAGTGVYLSLVHPLFVCACPVTTLFIQSAAVACAETLRFHSGAPVVIRPPNDLHVDGRKLGGILIEAVVRGERIEAVVTGIGVNVMDAPLLDDSRGASCTCLRDVASPKAIRLPTIRGLALALAAAVDQRHRQVMNGDSSEIDEAYRKFQRDR